MRAILELEGILRGTAKLTYGQVALVFIAGCFTGCAFFSAEFVPRALTWWGPLVALAPSLVWFGGAYCALRLMALFRSPFRLVVKGGGQ